MNTTRETDRVFPLSGGSVPRPPLRAPRLPSLIHPTPGVALGHHAFLRAWSGARGPTAAPTAHRLGSATPG